METIFQILSLTPEQTRVVGTVAIVLVFALDVIAHSDEVPYNTPRDWLLWYTQWKSLGLWNRERRRAVNKANRKWWLLFPLNYLPMTGVWVPFMCAVLAGHFFHPGFGPLIGPGGGVGLGVCIAAALAASVVTYFTEPGTGKRMVFYVTVIGFVCGVLVWPVSV